MTTQAATIKFNSRSETHAELSSFYVAPFTLDGEVWDTVEHYYQAQKFLPHDPEWAEQIRRAPRAGAAKRMSTSPEHTVRDDWDEVKEAAMLRGLRAKFGQDRHCRQALLSTMDCRLVEYAPWGDRFWGDGGDGSGLNRLGQMLMELRDSQIGVGDLHEL